MPRTTKAQLEAHVEALKARNDALEASLRSMHADLEEARFECRNLQSMLSAYRTGQVRTDVMHIQRNASALAVARALAAQGVPCYARGNAVYHSRTQALLASK